MAAIALVVSSADYSRLAPLQCCRTDAEAIHALLNATGRFDDIHSFNDLDAENLKAQLRAVLEPVPAGSEIFFYFSGHGHSEDGEFFFCPKDFDSRKPNATGLSNAELHALLRETSPELVVKVIDACSSGALLTKSGSDFLPADKGGLKNLVQIASCMDSQTSLTGEPLSEFTEQFCIAATRKTEGAVYYTDIVSVIRDQYISDRDRTPHFAFQFSARETFTDDASALEEFRSRFVKEWSSTPSVELVVGDSAVPEVTIAEPISLLDLLRETDERLAKPEEVATTISALFDSLKARLEGEAFTDYYETAAAESSSYDDTGSRSFMIRILTQQTRSDNFVTASIIRERKRGKRFTQLIAMGLYDDDEIVEQWDLQLNISLKRAQLSITLTPRFMALQKIRLVVTCAPSLERCYIFELATRHPRTDFQAFEYEGVELTRRWYKQEWGAEVGWLVDKIADSLEETIEAQLASAQERLSAP